MCGCEVVGDMRGRPLHDRSKDNAQSTDEHATTTTEIVDSRADERDANDAADLIHGRDNTSPDTRV